MKTAYKFFGPALLTGFLLLCSCSKSAVTEEEDTIDGTVVLPDDGFETNTRDLIFPNAVTIAFSYDEGVEITNPYESDGVTVTQSDGRVVVSSANGTEINYVLSGKMADGAVDIQSATPFGIVLNGVSLVSYSAPPLRIGSSQPVTIQLVDSTANRLIDSTAYSGNTPKGVLSSASGLIFNGGGSLLIAGTESPGIHSDGSIHITDGEITIAGTPAHGIYSGTFMGIEGGILDLTASGRGIECAEGHFLVKSGEVTITSAQEGIVTSYAGSSIQTDPYVQIDGGSVLIRTTGEQAHGIRSNGAVLVGPASLTIRTEGAAAQGIRCSGDISLDEGTIDIRTAGEAIYDLQNGTILTATGIDADGRLRVGQAGLEVSTEGDGGKGIETGGVLTLDGGEISVITTGRQFVYGTQEAPADGIRSRDHVVVNSGNISVQTSNTLSTGIESEKTLTIRGGALEIIAYDNCMHAYEQLSVEGGKVFCYSTARHGIVSENAIAVTGGTIVTVGAPLPGQGFHSGSGIFELRGGTVVALGGTHTFPDAATAQSSLVYLAKANINELFHVESASGAYLLTYKIPRIYSRLSLLFSSPDLQPGIEYTVYQGGEVRYGEDLFHGLYSNNRPDEILYEPGLRIANFTPGSGISWIDTVN